MYPVLVDPEFLSNELIINPEFHSNISTHHNFGNTHELKFNPDLLSNFPTHQNFENGIFENEIFQNHDLIDQKPPSLNFSGSCITPDSLDVPDFPDACLKFLSDILLEENLDEIPSTLQDFRALEATEKSLYDVLGEEYSPSNNLTSSLDQVIENSDDSLEKSWDKSHGVEGFVNGEATTFESNWVQKQTVLDPFLSLNDLSQSVLNSNTQSSVSSNSDDCTDGLASSFANTLSSLAPKKEDKVVSRSRRKKNQRRDDGANEGGRSSKHQASSNEDYVEMKQYDDVLLCREDKDDLVVFGQDSCSPNESSKKLQENSSKGKTKRGKKQEKTVDEVDLRTLLTHCAQAVSNFDLRSANERLKQIRQYSTPYGDSIQRLAHYFANALEARLAGTGSTMSSNIVDARVSSSDFLKAYRVYVSAIPTKRISFFLANNTIFKLAEKAERIHIIDFGVLLGLQWPCLIQLLANRPNGPPKLRITGIDYPQQGFRPAERVDATGRRLAGYSERFNVPFQYQGIAQKWDHIKPEDINIASDELVIVNCMFRSGTLLDETVEIDGQKDAFLKLVKQLNPDLFIHGVVNAKFNAPFFITRFREALIHYSSYFDLLEETIPREDHERLLLETEVHAKEILNVIACEGSERIQRPETYKQWQVRTTRAGFKQLPLDRELLSRTKAKVKANYRKDFLVDEDRNWMLQGWKGKTFTAISMWQSC